MSSDPSDSVQNPSGATPRWYGRRQVVWQVGAYVIINALFVALWATSGSNGHHGSFWPMWPIIFWGVALAFFLLRSFTATRP